MKIVLLLIGALCWVAAATSPLTAHHEDVVKHSEGASHHLGEHHSDVKHVKKSGKSSKHDEESSSKGQSGLVHHKKDDSDAHGKKSVSSEHSSHSDYETAGGGSHHGTEMKDAEKHKKGHSVKGFREQYHKNEHKNHDSYYSSGHKSGSWKNFGVKGSKYHSHNANKGDYNKRSMLKSGDKHGKQSKKYMGHKYDDLKGHKMEKGKKSGHTKHEKWAKNGHQKSQNKHKYKYTPDKF